MNNRYYLKRSDANLLVSDRANVESKKASLETTVPSQETSQAQTSEAPNQMEFLEEKDDLDFDLLPPNLDDEYDEEMERPILPPSGLNLSALPVNMIEDIDLDDER